MAVGMFSACSITKNVPPDDKLFKGSTVSAASGKLDKSIKNGLLKLTKPKPNSSFLGMKFRLMLFNAIKEPKKTKKGFFTRMKYKWGEPPVLLSTVMPKTTEARLSDYLFNNGFLRPVVKGTITISKSTASINYMTDPGIQVYDQESYFPTDSSNIAAIINKSAEKTLLKAGENLDINAFSRNVQE